MSTRYHYLSETIQQELKCIADTLLTPWKGILTADESITTIGKRLQEQGMSNDEETRRKWRLLLFSTAGIENYISGAVIIDETLHQKDDSGKLLVDYLKDRCIIPGIKVDCGLVFLPGSQNEFFTQGMDDLGDRLIDYKQKGCEFARWRCVFRIGENTPSHRAIFLNAESIAQFASICQSQGICPLIEPEVISEGNHDIQHCEQVTETVLSFVFRALNEHRVFLEGVVLKPNMVTAGMSHSERSRPDAVGEATIIAFQRTVPLSVPGGYISHENGLAFSSGGQTEEEATANLNSIVCAPGKKPWYLTFAFGRALQASAMRTWKGNTSNVAAAQTEFLKRVKANADAICTQEDASKWQSKMIPPNVPAVENRERSAENVERSPVPAISREEEYDVDHSQNFQNEGSANKSDMIDDECSSKSPCQASQQIPTSSPTGISPGHERETVTITPKSARRSSRSEKDLPSNPRDSPSSQEDPLRNLSTSEGETGDVGISRRVAPTYNPDPNPDVLGHKPELLPEWRNTAQWNKSIVGYESLFPPCHTVLPGEFRLRFLKDFQTAKEIRISDSMKLPLKLTLPLESKTPTIEEVTVSSKHPDISEQKQRKNC